LEFEGIGYEPVVNALFYGLNRPDLAKEFIPQILTYDGSKPDYGLQAELYFAMGFRTEAIKAKEDEQNKQNERGFGGALKNLFTFG
jgi:hypothetical protein